MPKTPNNNRLATFQPTPYAVRPRTTKTTNWEEIRRDLANLQIPGFPSTDVFKSCWASAIKGEINNCQQQEQEPHSSTHPSSSFRIETASVKIDVRIRHKTTNLSDSDTDLDSDSSYSKSYTIQNAAPTNVVAKPEEPVVLRPERMLPSTYDVSIRKTSFRQFAEKRLIRDVEEFRNETYPGIFAAPTEDDIFLWTTSITGPDYSPYAGGIFEGFIQFTSEYPYVPPTLTFTSNIFHPNITEAGVVCFNSYLNNWTPCYSLGAFLMAAQYMLGDPSTIEPANLLAAKLFDSERATYNEIGKQCVSASARATAQADEPVNNTPEALSPFRPED